MLCASPLRDYLKTLSERVLAERLTAKQLQLGERLRNTLVNYCR